MFNPESNNNENYIAINIPNPVDTCFSLLEILTPQKEEFEFFKDKDKVYSFNINFNIETLYAFAGLLLTSFFQSFVGQLGKSFSDSLLKKKNNLSIYSKPSQTNEVLNEINEEIKTLEIDCSEEILIIIKKAKGECLEMLMDKLKVSGLSNDDYEQIINQMDSIIICSISFNPKQNKKDNNIGG